MERSSYERSTQIPNNQFSYFSKREGRNRSKNQSGMQKKDYFVRSCIYNKVCVVGKKEVIYQLVEELQLMQYNIAEILKQFEEQEILLSDEGLEQMKNDCLDMLKAIIWMLDGAKYLWQGTEKSPDSGNC